MEFTEEPFALPDDDPAGIAVQPVTKFCTSTKGSVVPPFGWKEYEKTQQGISDTYGMTVNGVFCAIGTGSQGELDAKACCALAGYRYVTPTVAQIAAYAPLVVLLLVFLAIGAYQKWRRDVKKVMQKPINQS